MIELMLDKLNHVLWNWPLILFFIGVGLIATVALRFLQFRYFGKALRLLFGARKEEKQQGAEISPMQAFMNVLSTSIGNGSLAGMSTAIASGGPGAAFWVFVLGVFGLIIRFCEVYLSDTQAERMSGAFLGGPMIYLKRVPGGKFLPYFYAFFLLLLTFAMGNAMQTNSVTVGIKSMVAINPYLITLVVGMFVTYLMFGGAARILKVSDIVVPFKVGIYFISALYVLFYHWSSIFDALKLIVTSAFNTQAVAGGVVGFSMVNAIRFGMARSLNATEAGLGTAGVLFGSTGSGKPVENGLMSLVSTFVSNYLVCFMLMLIIVVSGVWDNGQTSTALTISAFQTAFGEWGGWVVTFLSILFGMGVLVSYAFIGRETWKFLTNGRFLGLYSVLYIAFAAFGTLASVGAVWAFCDVIIAGLVFTNVFGILWLLPEIRKGVARYDAQQK